MKKGNHLRIVSFAFLSGTRAECVAVVAALARDKTHKQSKQEILTLSK